MPRRITTASGAVLLTGAGLMLVAGCAGASGSSSAGSGVAARPALHGLPKAAAGVPAAGVGASAPEALGTARLAQSRLAPSGQSIIYTANLTVRVQNAAASTSAAGAYVSGTGGYTAAETAVDSHSPGRRPTVSLTLKVPVAQYPAALRRLAGLGTQTALSQQSTDVTQEVADVSSRVTSQQDAIAALRKLLARAGSVTGLLSVQQQISSDESALEALLAQQRSLAHETTYATISLLLLGPRPHPVVHHQKARHHGFASGLAGGWHGLDRATSWTLNALGVILPFAAIIAILGGLGYGGRRWLARRQARPAATEQSA